jgi:hypothetical protein
MGFGPADQSGARKEEERQAVERAIRNVREILGNLKSVTSPSDAERLHDRVKNACTDKRLSLEFKRWAFEHARTYECNANMRACDHALRQAMRYASDEQMKERGKALSDARTFFGKACSLGAYEEFRKAAQRLIDTIMMTGNVRHAGPTRAKPKDFAPKPPNRAKS